LRVLRPTSLAARILVTVAVCLCATGARAEDAPEARSTDDVRLLVASAVDRPVGRQSTAPASQVAPASQIAFRLRLASTSPPPEPQSKLELELQLQRPAPYEGPRFHRVKPFVEMLSYQVFLTAAGWLYGNSPLDWRKPTWAGWKYRVTHAPLWRDGDNWALNYLGHAVFGSDHYLMARNCGWSWYSSVLFNTFGSFFWEYVTEGLFERPSAIDLVTTPILGSLLGEARYQLFRVVRKRWDRRWYGYVLLAIIDPTTMFFEMWGWR
jgi:hypothetical protein